jgi:hypothetical protein
MNLLDSANLRPLFVFHHFPITRNLVLANCRQFSVLGFNRGSLGSFYTAIVRRLLCSGVVIMHNKATARTDRTAFIAIGLVVDLLRKSAGGRP